MRNLAIALLLLAFVSCQKKESETLQEYMVEKTADPEFISFDLSSSMMNMKPDQLTDEQQRTLKAVRKVNVMAFKRDSLSQNDFAAEAKKVKKFLKDPQYQELMHVNSGADGGSISFVGENNDIDEVILFAASKETGFAVIRVIGKDLKSENVIDMLSLIRQSNVEIQGIEPIKKLLEPQPFLMH